MAAYVHAVKDGSFPNPDREGYAIDPAEWESFLRAQAQDGHAKERRPESADAETTKPAEFRSSALPCASESDGKTGKKIELHTL